MAIGIVFSNVVFLLCRSLMKPNFALTKVKPTVHRIPMIDTLVILRPLAAKCINAFVPCFCTYVNWISNDPVHKMRQAFLIQNKFFLVDSTFRSIAFIFFIFVPYDEGPELWVKYAPISNFVVSILTSLISPILLIIYSLVLFITLKPRFDWDSRSCHTVFYTVYLVTELFDFFYVSLPFFYAESQRSK